MHMRRCIMLLCVGCLFLTSESQSQTAPRPKKVLTPEQQSYQDQLAKWRKDYEALRVKATDALKKATALSESSECRNAGTTYDITSCFFKQNEATAAEYASFTSSLRDMLALAAPEFPGEKRMAGPSGFPLTAPELTDQFDQLESRWKAYRDIAAKATHDQWGGGSGGPPAELSARIQLLRSHMQELLMIYDMELTAR
jgi:hypothetical protein